MKTKQLFDRVFLKRLLVLSGPILLQNLFMVLGSSVTTLMTGSLGDAAIAASGLLRQFTFFFSLVLFGVSSGCAVFTAQFWGKNDKASIHKTLGIALILGVAAGILFTVFAFAAPYLFLRLFTKDPAVIAAGSRLLRIAGPSFLLLPLIYAYTYIQRTTGETRLPMLSSGLGVLTNLLLGYGLIHGKFGLPNLGVDGAAAANLASRIAESGLLIYLTYRYKTSLAARLRDLFSFDRAFFKRVIHRVLPVISNEFIWGLGMTAYSAIFARLGTEAYAAVTIKDSVENILFVPALGITGACAVLVGNTIGVGKPEKAQSYVRQTVLLIASIGLVLGTILFLGREWFLGLFNVSNETRKIAAQLFLVLAAVQWLRSSNFVFFVGMMRSGGDTRFAYKMDVGAMWGIGVPLALIGTLILKLPLHLVYLLIMCEEVVKFLVSIRRYRSKRWIHNVVNN